MSRRLRRWKGALLLSLLALMPAVSAHVRRTPVYDTYTNFKYFYAVDYPRGLLIPQGEPDAGDGQVFLSRRGGAAMIVYASYNVFNESLTALYHAALSRPSGDPELVITYRYRSGTEFVVSGHDGAQVFYERLMMRGDRILTLQLHYPAREGGLYSPVTAHVARSLQLLPRGMGTQSTKRETARPVLTGRATPAVSQAVREAVS